MYSRRMIPVALLAMVAIAMPVRAQGIAPTKVAVANTAQIFSQLQEVKDLTVKMNNDQRSLQADEQRRKADLENLMNTRNQFKPDSDQWSDANQKYIKAAVDYRSWAELTQIDQQREAKLHMSQIFSEIQQEATALAKQMGYDIVLSQQAPDLAPAIEDPQVSFQQFRGLVTQYKVLYAGSAVDISDKIVTALDATYKSRTSSAPAAGK
ncbi:MAG TPA: OmpH family outer membrane protein [Tepidisphaeraceae bacterium]|nr:OmpH family outer membrane protein [Tepidisphaeraceae bacterium]